MIFTACVRPFRGHAMDDREQIARFQEAFLELLAADLSVEEKYEALCTQEQFARYRDQLKSWDPRFLSVAVELLRKWGSRSEPVGTGSGEGGGNGPDGL